MMIVNDDSSVISEQSFKLIDDARGVIYDCPIFIIQATGAAITKSFLRLIPARLSLPALQCICPERSPEN